MRLSLPGILLRLLLLLHSTPEHTLALAVPSNSTDLADKNFNISLIPFPQQYHVPGTPMTLDFYEFGPRLRYEDGDGLLKAAKQDVDLELSLHRPGDQLGGDYWAVDEPPLELAIRSTNPQSFPLRGGLKYIDLENAVEGLRLFFPFPWWQPAPMSSAYWGAKFDILVLRGVRQNQRVGTGSLGYIDQTSNTNGAGAGAITDGGSTSR